MTDPYLIATILSIVEGLTEFLPVSSTGHLIITSSLLGVSGEKIKSFEVFIQLGAILAVLSLYRQQFAALFDLKQSHGFSGKEGMLKIILGCLPILVLGALFHKQIKHYLFGVNVVAWALIVGGVVMLFIERSINKPKVFKLNELSNQQALKIGLLQCLALWPGMSRSASSMIAGMFFGLDKRCAAEFSFILAVPVLSAAALFELLKIYQQLNQQELLIFIYGAALSFFVAKVGIKLLLGILRRWSMLPFGIYRIVLGVILLVYTR